jgi:hypothetical protein
MPKRKRGFTRKKYEEWIKEGRGQRSGVEYKPWLLIQDVPSNGESTRIHGVKIDRQHDLLSRNEKNYFYIVEYAENVIDIMEQYPLLPIEQTEIIAADMGVEHPADPFRRENSVLTCDFFLKINCDGKEKYIARTIKELDELNNERQMQKFEIERRYWEFKGINWGIVTENEISKTLSKNISNIRPFYSLIGIKGFEYFTELEIEKLTNEYKQFIQSEKVNVRTVSKDFDDKLKLESGSGIKIFKHLLWKKQILTNLHISLCLDRHIDIKLVSNSWGEVK